MVASYTQLLAERYRGKLDETADKYIGYASEGALRMQQLIADLCLRHQPATLIVTHDVVESMLLVPMILGEQVTGVIVLSNAETGEELATTVVVAILLIVVGLQFRLLSAREQGA